MRRGRRGRGAEGIFTFGGGGEREE